MNYLCGFYSCGLYQLLFLTSFCTYKLEKEIYSISIFWRQDYILKSHKMRVVGLGNHPMARLAVNYHHDPHIFILHFHKQAVFFVFFSYYIFYLKYAYLSNYGNPIFYSAIYQMFVCNTIICGYVHIMFFCGKQYLLRTRLCSFLL